MDIKFEYLVDRSDDVLKVTTLWYSVWADRMGPDLESITEQFRTSLSRKSLPLDIVAILDGEIVGTAALKDHEMKEIYPEHQFWLGSVFVTPTHRSLGIASLLTKHIIELANERRLPQLYLQTTDMTGGLYAKLGWVPLEQLFYKNTDTLLMVKKLN
jgi:GNAT superfamily N-acetyltransferase